MIKFKNLCKKLVYTPYVLAYLASASVHAEGYDIGGGGSGIWGKIVSFFQDFVNFATGPGALFIFIISIIAGVILFVLAPRMSESVGTMMRAAIGGIVLLNIPLLVTYVKGGA